MTGEVATPRLRVSVQPGGRGPAPGDLALVQAFINSHYDLEVEHGAELLATPDAARRWLHDHGLIRRTVRVAEADVKQLLELREALRGVAGHKGDLVANANALRTLNDAALGAAIEVRFEHGEPRLVTAAPGSLGGALATLLAITAQSMFEGSWARLKVCPGDHCGWAFYDHSRNQTGRWCSMSVCGGRAKARAHYRRRRGEAS